MRSLPILLLTVLMVAAPAAQPGPPLAGAYTVGTGGDFPTPAAAAAALTEHGVAAAVTFSVAAGSYEGALALGAVTGASADHPVRFMAEGEVELVAGAPAVIHLDGARHVRFEGFAVRLDVEPWANGHALRLAGALQDVVFRGNHFVRPPSGPSNRNEVVYAEFSGSAPHFIGNTFEGGREVYLLGQCAGGCPGLVFEANTVAAHLNVYGLVAPRIERNRIEGPFTGQFLRSTVEASPVIINNVVRSTGRTLFLGSSEHVRLYHNTFVGHCGSTSTIEGNVLIGNASGAHLVGNAFVCATAAAGFAPGIALAVNPASGVTVSDRNAFHTPGPFVASLAGTLYRSLDDLRASAAWAGKDAHSVTGYVALDADLRTDAPWLARAGAPLAEVPTDIEGNPRDSVAPSIGAYEFTSTRTLLPAGTYTVGTGGTYPTLAAAADDLAQRGTGGAVTFALSGTLTGPAVLRGAYGLGPEALLTVASASGEPPAVLRVESAGVPALRLDGARHVRLENIAVDASDRHEQGFNAVVMGPGVQDVEVRGVTFRASAQQTTVPPWGGGATVYLDGLSLRDVRFEDNRFEDGVYAVSTAAGGAFNQRFEGFVFARNEVEGGLRGLYLNNLGAPRIEANRIRVQAQGILMETSGGVGEGEDAVHGLIANNAIRVLFAEAIRLSSTVRQRVFHNTLSVGTCPAATSISGALHLHGAQFAADAYTLRNNVVACETGGRALSFVAGQFVSSDHNHFYSPGPQPFGTNAQSWATLADYQVATGLDANSTFAEVPFVSATDLRIIGLGPDDFRGTGETLPVVAVDLLGEARPDPPRKGAYEAQGAPVSTEPEGPGAEPLAFAFDAAFPNPAANRATVRFTTAEAGPVSLSVWDVLGREMLRVLDAPLAAGRHEAALDLRALASGTYVLRLDAGAHQATRRLTVIR